MITKVKKYGCVILSCIMLIGLCAFPVFADGNGDNSDSSDQSGNTSEFVDSQTTTNVLRVSASDTNGLHSIILSLIGDYNPIAVTTQYRYPSGSTYQTREQVDVVPDWSWIASAFVFCIVLYSFFRILGTLFGGGKR